jgi:hypothetical protein
MTGRDADELRTMVREVLREVLPQAVSPQRPDGAGVRRVRVADDGDLDDLVRQVLDLAADPERLADLRAGRLRFALVADEQGRPPARTESTAAPPLDVERGAVTERLVNRAAREQRALRIGSRAVVTPLARDRARALGVSIERTTASSEQGREPR